MRRGRPVEWRITKAEDCIMRTCSDNVLPRFELFLLDDGQQKVEYKEETRKFIDTSLRLLLTIHFRCTQHCHLHIQQRRPHTRQPPLPASAQVRPHRLLRVQSSPPTVRNVRAPRPDRRHNHTQGGHHPVLQGHRSGFARPEQQFPDRVARQEDCQRGRGG